MLREEVKNEVLKARDILEKCIEKAGIYEIVYIQMVINYLEEKIGKKINESAYWKNIIDGLNRGINIANQ